MVTDFGRTPGDPRTSDQREGTRRLEEGTPEITVKPLLDALPVGHRLLVVCSARGPEPDATALLRLVVRALRPDPRAGGRRRPVDGFLFTNTGG